ncbi:MAG: hypothetical protein C0582_04685 [Alphaproteobacteria bacterium]|nr:MAG: hypothetical protein C0582_04685 [Alphaproteobacteria bacterium]
MHPSRDVDGKDCRVLFEGTNFQIDRFFINGHLPGSSPFDIWKLARDAYKDLVKPISRAKLKTSIPYDQIAKELQSKTYEILGDGFHQLPTTEFRHQNWDAHRLKAINPEGLDFNKFLAETSKEFWQKDQPVGRGILKIGVDGHPVLAFEYYVDNQYVFQRQSICLLTSVV